MRGRDFEHALNKALDYGGKAATAYQVGKAAYAAGRFILPLILKKRCCTAFGRARIACTGPCREWPTPPPRQA